MAAAATLFYSGCNDSSDSDVTSGGHVDDLIDTTRETDDPKSGSYTLKIIPTPTVGGSVSKSPDKAKYSTGEYVMVTATAETGYRFTGWTGDTASTNNSITIKMNGNKELIANFLQENAVSYTLTLNASPTVGGTVSKSPDKLEYAAGEMVYVTAASKPGYAFTIWSGALSSRDSAFTITMDSKKELTANFAPRTYTLTVNEENGGSVSRSPGKSAYEYDEKVTVTAYPDNGYKFKEWSGAATGTKNPVTVTIDGDKTLSASFEWIGTTPPPNVSETKYTLAAYPSPTDGGEVSRNPDKNAYTSGEKVTVTAYPANGYKFTGWSGAATSTNTSITVTMDGDKMLTADFELITYTVTFSANGGSGSVSNQSAQAGNSITLPSGYNLSKNGFTFDGWNTNAYGTGTNYSGGSSFFVTGDVTLYANWETIPTYTVSFNANGGSGSVPSQNAQEGNSIILPDGDRLSRNGYTFGWWNTDRYGTGGDYGAGSSFFVTDDVTLYAVWNEVSVTSQMITLNANGGTVNPVSVTTGPDGSLSSLPTPTRNGYTFNGWYSAAAGGAPVTELTRFTGNATIYAQWTLVTYTITFNANGGTVSPTSGTTGEGGRLASLPTPTRNGYTFNGWFTAATGGAAVTESREYSANAAIYAQWTLNTYTIAFDANGGTVSPTSSTTGEGGKLTSLPTPTRTGYNFSGWYTTSTGGTQVTTSTAFSAGVTIYAQWTLNAYTITFNANGGTVSPASGTTGEGGKLTSLPTPTRTGYAFNGWYTASTGGTQITTGTAFSAITTIYAQWMPAYTITFDANGGTVSPASGKTGEGGKLTSLPTPTINGYAFNGWFTATTGGTAVTTSTVFTANTTIYAQWIRTYTVTFNANGGSGSAPSAQTVNSGSSITLPSQGSLTRTGYRFVGWNSESSGGGRNYPANFTFTPERTFTLYAIWDWVGKGNDISNYKTISIGEQRWMAENLDYNVEGSKCYGNSADSCAKYGRLYTWTTAMGGASSSSANPSGVQGVCPVGWHLPSDGEWTTLTNYVGSGAGTKLKSQSGWVDGNGTDEYGFSALPGGTDAQGSGCYGAEWCDAGFRGSWWSATAPASDGATYRTMRYDIDYVHIYTFYKSKFFSIRCVAD